MFYMIFKKEANSPVTELVPLLDYDADSETLRWIYSRS